ncbi:MAG: hypothetical protein QM758_12035 [Armatimonas sp.]
MAQFNKKTAYMAFGLLAIGALAYVYTEPETAAKKVKVPTTSKKTAKSDDVQITPEDLKANFPRVSSATKDAFRPGVSTGKGGAAKPTTPLRPVVIPPPPAKQVEGVAALSAWTLTGISLIDGIRTALIENKGSGDSTFLKTGSLWKGLQVTSITSEELVFLEPGGKQLRVTFPVPPEEKTTVQRAMNDAPADPGTETPRVPRNSRRQRGATLAGLTGPATENGAQL